eukprot:TRINITY_DN10143_c0_g1_i2.p1 TRINITY_DN10143_c0_g1~~TRINITY_DN10143_c0_g1_i2.p1  ORF type:complete len:118 (-),score=5.46 TRINITY_DN10143_c0_g1_i2:150-503(-)
MVSEQVEVREMDLVIVEDCVCDGDRVTKQQRIKMNEIHRRSVVDHTPTPTEKKKGKTRAFVDTHTLAHTYTHASVSTEVLLRFYANATCFLFQGVYFARVMFARCNLESLDFSPGWH